MEYPSYQSVNTDFRDWPTTGVWEHIYDTLRGETRKAAVRSRIPSVPESSTASRLRHRTRRYPGYDSGKTILGHKRHLVVDVFGLLLIIKAHTAGVQDRAGAESVL